MISPDLENRAFLSHTKAKQSPTPKLSLLPSCAVFPEGLSDFRSQPPTSLSDVQHTSPPKSPPTTDQFDYFQWSGVPTPISDISDPAPVGAIGDDHSGELRSSQSGTWYSISRRLQTPAGFALVPDEYAQTARRPRQHSHGEFDHHHRNSSCSFPCTYCTKCMTSRRLEPGRPRSENTAYSTFADSFNTETDDCETCDHELWDHPLKPCFVHTLQEPPSPPTNGNNPTFEEITADMAAGGVDIQGIPWDTLPFSRADYRSNRLHDQIRNRELVDYTEGLKNFLKEPKRGAQYFEFFSNTRAVKCSIVHFQLRNLAWATSKHDVYVMHDASIVHWDAATKRKSMVLDLSGAGVAGIDGLGVVQISTMIAKDDLVIAGGFYGEMVAKNVRTNTIVHNKRITFHDNAITNAIDIFDGTVMASNNDCHVRSFDLERFEMKNSFSFSCPVNHATRQPGGKMVAVAGDDNVVQVIDGDTGDRIAQLRGHEHYSFATGWHPNGRMFATGSQDRTCHVWDVRNMSQSVCVLGARMGAIRSLRFSSCGRFLMMAEPRDFVHVYDVNGGNFNVCQEMDLFGEIAGIAITPGSESLFIAVSDRMYSSLLEFERKNSSSLFSNML